MDTGVIMRVLVIPMLMVLVMIVVAARVTMMTGAVGVTCE